MLRDPGFDARPLVFALPAFPVQLETGAITHGIGLSGPHIVIAVAGGPEDVVFTSTLLDLQQLSFVVSVGVAVVVAAPHAAGFLHGSERPGGASFGCAGRRLAGHGIPVGANRIGLDLPRVAEESNVRLIGIRPLQGTQPWPGDGLICQRPAVSGNGVGIDVVVGIVAVSGIGHGLWLRAGPGHFRDAAAIERYQIAPVFHGPHGELRSGSRGVGDRSDDRSSWVGRGHLIVGATAHDLTLRDGPYITKFGAGEVAKIDAPSTAIRQCHRVQAAAHGGVVVCIVPGAHAVTSSNDVLPTVGQGNLTTVAGNDGCQLRGLVPGVCILILHRVAEAVLHLGGKQIVAAATKNLVWRQNG